MRFFKNNIREIKQPGSGLGTKVMGSVFVLRNKKSSALLNGLMLLTGLLLVAPITEAAKPKAVVAKIAPVNEGATVTLDGSRSSDKDGDTLIYNWVQTKGTTVNLNKVGDGKTATFTAPAIIKTDKQSKPVKLTFQLTVDDGKQGIAKKTVVVTVKPSNILPIANAGTDQTVNWASAASGIALNAAGSTDDGQIVKYQWKLLSKLPKKLKFKLLNAKAANASFTLVPEQTSPVSLNFQLTVTDNDKKTSKDTVTVTISQGLAGPVANAGTDQTVASAATVNLDGGQSSGTIDSYLWAQTAGTAVTLNATNTPTSSFTAPTVTAPTVLTFKLTITNSAGSSEDFVEITVNPGTAAAPVANAGSDQSVASAAVVNLNGNQSTGTIDSYLWAQTAGPSVSLSSTNAASTSFTAPVVISPTVLTFKLTTSNSAGSTDDMVNITVTPAQAVNLTGTLTLQTAEADLNDPVKADITEISGGASPYTVTFDWGDGKTSGPTTLAADVVAQSAEHYYAEKGNYTVKVTVADANHQSAEFNSPVAITDSLECK